MWGHLSTSLCSGLSPMLTPLHARMLSCFSCVQLCNPIECSLSGSSVHGILQVRILDFIAMPSTRVSSSPRD